MIWRKYSGKKKNLFIVFLSDPPQNKFFRHLNLFEGLADKIFFYNDNQLHTRMIHVRIKRLDQSIELPKYQTVDSAGFDFQAAQDMVIESKEIAKIPTGLIIQSPPGYYMQLSARSSLGGKKGLQVVNGVGIIDRDYSGPEDQIFIVVRNFTDQPVTISKGERLAQGIFLPVQQAVWEEVAEIKAESRGGVGSTGGYSH